MVNWLEQHFEKFPIGVYVGRELKSRGGLSDDFLGDKFECLLLGVWIGSFDGLMLGPNEGIVPSKALEYLDGLLFGKYYGI